MLPLRDNVPTRHVPVVTLALIAANVAVWAWEATGTPVDVDIARFGYYPCSVSGPCLEPPGVPTGELSAPVSVFTSMFMHASLGHLVGNMLFLWIFGNNVEDALGRVRFLLWYLAGGVVAMATQTFVTLSFGTLEAASTPHVGASGAVSAVLGAYFVLLPGARVLTLFGWLLVEVPALVYLGVWFAFQLWAGSASFLEPESSGGVAFFAHVGGFAFGALTVRLVATRRPLAPRF